ncbi:sensor histidine kinase [Pontibacter ummariensis]|uniref:sensor histidine kinase n=1 Tax=Pontibacter ummariensis TaxID=1610492 RepID=UPI00118723BE|nr:histidine kinase [Pontibacter ummariensis]
MKLVNNYRIRLIGILTITALRFGFYSSDMMTGVVPFSWPALLENLLLTLLMAVTIWEATRAVVVYFNKRHPLHYISGHRFAKEALFVILANTLVYALTLLLFFFTDPESEPHAVYLFFGFLDRFLYGILVAAFYELLLFIEAWRTATKEAEELKKVNLMVQLESLKNQVKPHFLFNSLNTLTGLVEKDPSQAVKFIAELSKVYRYLLQSNEKELIALSQELQFTEAYFYLLQTRFGQGISLQIAITESAESYLIPPLTLQMLVENAVKHNQVSARKPLHIKLSLEDGEWLRVENNYQPKRNPAPSNGMGLSNIASKYRLLSQPEVIIRSDENSFRVKVPLIKPVSHEHIYS